MKNSAVCIRHPKAKIIRTIKGLKVCEYCGNTVSEKTNPIYFTREIEKPRESLDFSEEKPKKKRILTDAQKYMMNKRIEEKKEIERQARKKEYYAKLRQNNPNL